MPLCYAEIGQMHIIQRIIGKPEVKVYLETLGFVVGATVSVMNTMGGSLIVRVKGSRVAISRELAQKITV